MTRAKPWSYAYVLEETSGTRTNLEWVTCPVCSATFRVAIPTQYLKVTIGMQPDYTTGTENQQIRCIGNGCQVTFCLLLRQY